MPDTFKICEYEDFDEKNPGVEYWEEIVGTTSDDVVETWIHSIEEYWDTGTSHEGVVYVYNSDTDVITRHAWSYEPPPIMQGTTRITSAFFCSIVRKIKVPRETL